MKIKNLVAKPIGIGEIILLPGSDFTDVPDEMVYVPVFDKRGNKTDEKEILPSLRALERMNQIVMIETKATAKAPVKEKPEEPVEEPVEQLEEPTEQPEEPTEKKPRGKRK